jgi:hypothetical protein
MTIVEFLRIKIGDLDNHQAVLSTRHATAIRTVPSRAILNRLTRSAAFQMRALAAFSVSKEYSVML